MSFANRLLNISQAFSGRSSRLANWFRAKADAAAGQEHKLKVVISEDNSRIDIEYVPVENTETTMWGHYYENAGLFVQNRPQEIELDHEQLRENKMELTRTADVAPVLKTNIVKQLFGFGQGETDRQELMNMAQLGGIAILVVFFISTM